jgi:hypothetical protein
MARMVEESLVIKVSRLVKDQEEVSDVFQTDTLQQLELIMSELVNDQKSIIEIIIA